MATATELNIQTCRRCPAKIVFLKTKTGSNVLPIDAATVQPGDTEYDHTRHVSHFATCPEAAKFRKPKPELTMTMTFYNETITDRFVTLCRQRELHGTIKTKHAGPTDDLHAGRPRWKVTVTGFKNRTAMANFTATWAALTMERA